EPTVYGDALLTRSVAVFDDLKQIIRDIQFLSDASTGEVRVGCMEAPWFTLLPDVIRRFSRQYPRIQVHTDLIDHSEAFLALRERRYDCVLIAKRPQYTAADDLTEEILYDDEVIVVACAHSKWARRRKIDLADLMQEPWVAGGPRAWGGPPAEGIFSAAGPRPPHPHTPTNPH